MIDRNLRDELLSHYPEKYHDSLKKQILAITDTIEQHQMEYTYSLDFKKALDIVVAEILNGKFLGIDPLDDEPMLVK